MKANELEIIELALDLPEYGLTRGAHGTVVEVFETPEQAYMVEFVDASGQSSVIADWVTAKQIKNVGTGRRHSPKELLAAYSKFQIGKSQIAKQNNCPDNS